MIGSHPQIRTFSISKHLYYKVLDKVSISYKSLVKFLLERRNQTRSLSPRSFFGLNFVKVRLQVPGLIFPLGPLILKLTVILTNIGMTTLGKRSPCIAIV